MKEFFLQKKFGDEALELIEVCNGILTTYEEQGFDLSLRQLYYQLVSRNIVPNTEPSYKRVGCIISDARLAGSVDWEMIKDRGRECLQNSHWKNPAEIAMSAARSFRINRWETQPVYVEVMVEKQALEGVLQPVCRDLDVPFSANKGYASSSAFYEAGKRLAEKADEGKELVMIYLGDHDPSGIDMTRDVQERMELFSREGVRVIRLALNMPQIQELNPPENPAKLTDSRAGEYIRRFGSSSWELDAIEPRQLADMVTREVVSLRDEDEWVEATEKQEAMRAELMRFAENYGAGE